MNRLKTPGNIILVCTLILCFFLVFNSFTELKSTNLQTETTLSYLINNLPIEPGQDTVFSYTEKMPLFPGGSMAIFRFINQNIRYPESALKNKIQGKVIVQFIINNSGEVKNAKVIKGVSPELDQEALRVVNSFPVWIPGEQHGKKVSVYQTIPIVFKYTPFEISADTWHISDSTLIVIDSLKMPLKFNLNVINPEAIDTGSVNKPFPSENKNKLISRYGPLAKNGVVQLTTSKDIHFFKDTSGYKPGDENYIYQKTDKMPQYPGGDYKLMNYIAKNLKYPVVAQENGIQGKVIIRFVVDKTGKIRFPKIVRSIDPLLDNEALQVIKSLTGFIPGEKDGKKVNVYFTLPIGFKLEGIGLDQSGYEYDGDTKKLLVVIDGEKLPVGFDRNWLDFGQIISYKISTPVNKKVKQELLEKFGNDGMNGVIEITSLRNIQKKSMDERPKDSQGNHIYQVIEVMPQFPGGENKLMKFITENLKYPEDSKAKQIHGRVIVRFVVNSTGNIERSEVIRSLDPACDKEALRVINSSPTWTPGRQNGVNVSVWYTIPIYFNLE